MAQHQVKSPISVWNDIMEGVTEASQVQQAQNTLYSLEICLNSNTFKCNSNDSFIDGCCPGLGLIRVGQLLVLMVLSAHLLEQIA